VLGLLVMLGARQDSSVKTGSRCRLESFSSQGTPLVRRGSAATLCVVLVADFARKEDIGVLQPVFVADGVLVSMQPGSDLMENPLSSNAESAA